MLRWSPLKYLATKTTFAHNFQVANYVTAKEAIERAQKDPNDLVYGFNDIEKRKGLRRPIHSWETSVEYMDSETYKKTYGDQLIWKLYRRNTPRKFFTYPLPVHWCLKFGKFATNWPCPICRDEYLVIDYRNVRLLKQFLVEATGHLYENHVVNVCQVNYHKIAAEVMKAKNRGHLTFDLPFRNYDYKDYYKWWNGPKEETVPEEPECYEVGRDKPYTEYPIHNPEHKPYW